MFELNSVAWGFVQEKMITESEGYFLHSLVCLSTLTKPLVKGKTRAAL